MTTFFKTTWSWFKRALGLWLLLALLTGEGPSTQDQRVRLKQLSGPLRFDFITWELQALAQKAAYGLLAPQRFMDDTAQAEFVLTYLDNVREAQQLTTKIERSFVQPEIQDPLQATAAERQALAALRNQIGSQAPLAEAILGEQVSQVLRQGGFGVLGQIFPPVSGTFTPLPYLLIVSPRARIESLFQAELVAGLDAAQQQALERRIETAEKDLSAYVTPIGGLSAYPAMLLETASIEWATDVLAHEWTHHYLLRGPLGWRYNETAEIRNINETTASLLGEWAGQEAIRRFYAPLLNRPKLLPEPLLLPPRDESTPNAFDFRAAMYETRVTVDRLLAEGRIEEAEAYMEQRRQYLVAQGYRLRRLNQAYFAFHGAYASQPGAAGQDPVGPAVRRLWAVSESPGTFVRRISRALTVAQVEALTAQRAGQR